MARTIRAGLEPLSVETIVQIGTQNLPLSLDPGAIQTLADLRVKLEAQLGEGRAIYGVNTGFGFFSTCVIAKNDLMQLQLNLVRSHACGVGEPLAPEWVRALLAVKIHNFMQGGSGVRPACVTALWQFLQHDILPVIPRKGSVGASGDLAPLAHLALALLGEGEVFLRGTRMPTAQALQKTGLSPYILQEKEGLSLLNGTQVMSTLAAFALQQSKNLLEAADIVSALSLTAFDAVLEPFDARIHQLRPHPGQIQVAQNIRTLLETPETHIPKNSTRVQDPYSFRCIPQVHGAARDAITYCTQVIDRELNSITDNPVMTSEGDLLSGGNFHGQYIAQVMDLTRIVMTDLGSISERRMDKLLSPHFSQLPALLTENGGLESGFMIPQYVAAALVSENKVLSYPASIDTIPTSLNKEDHVSMGPIACHKALEITQNVAKILAIEAIAACQALDLRDNRILSAPMERVYTHIRSQIPYMKQDRSLSKEIEQVATAILDGSFLDSRWNLGQFSSSITAVTGGF